MNAEKKKIGALCAAALAAAWTAQGAFELGAPFRDGCVLQRDRVITWMDVNAPYYPVYESAYPENPAARFPLSVAERHALDLIRVGQLRLAEKPRGDVEEGFTPCARDRARLERYARREKEEQRMWKAIREGRREYDR